MSNACTPTLVGMASPVLELKLAFKFGQNFSFRPWTIVHGGQNIESTQNNCASRG